MKPRVTVIDCRTVEEANLIVNEFAREDVIAFIRVDGTGRRRRGDAGQKIQVQVCADAYDEAKDLKQSLVSQPARLPMPWMLRCAGLFLPIFHISGLIMFGMLEILYRRRGQEGCAKELARWFALGLVLWGSAALLLFFVSNYSYHSK